MIALLVMTAMGVVIVMLVLKLQRYWTILLEGEIIHATVLLPPVP